MNSEVAMYSLAADSDAEFSNQTSHLTAAVHAHTTQAPTQILFRVGMTLEEIERQVLLTTLAHFNNHKPAAAQALGISLKTVYNRLARLGHADDFSDDALTDG